MQLAGMLKRALLRSGGVCAGAVIDVRCLDAPEMQRARFVRVSEISPEGDVCHIGRGTQILLDFSPPAAEASAAASSARAASGRGESDKPMHPALLALHSLLLRALRGGCVVLLPRRVLRAGRRARPPCCGCICPCIGRRSAAAAGRGRARRARGGLNVGRRDAAENRAAARGSRGGPARAGAGAGGRSTHVPLHAHWQRRD